MPNPPQSAPPLPLRIPLRRTTRTRRTPPRPLLALSLGAHVVLGLCFAAAATHDLQRAGGPRPPPAAELASYLDLAAWPAPRSRDAASAVPGTPGPVPGAAPAARSAPAPAASSTAPGADSGGVAEPASAGLPASDPPARATRLRPAPGDPRLVATPRPLADRPPPEAERHLAAFQAALRAVRDSLQDHVDRERRVSSWTWTDPDGRAWGVRNGVLFIAGKPTVYVEIQGARDHELARRAEAWQREDGRRQGERIERERHLAERARAMRERRDSLRSDERP